MPPGRERFHLINLLLAFLPTIVRAVIGRIGFSPFGRYRITLGAVRLVVLALR